MPDRMFVHYAASPIVDGWVVPWSELGDELRSSAGHFGKVHDGRPDGQYKPDAVYCHELRHFERPADLQIGTAYATDTAWVYEVEPEGPVSSDPERGGHLVTSRTCRRARVLRSLRWPRRDDLLSAIRDATGRGARGDAARLLMAGHRTGELNSEDLRDWVPHIWTYLSPPSGPHGALSGADWLELFRAMGIYIASPEIDLGPGPYMIYRAAPAERACGMSWCTHEAMARDFLPKHQMYGDYRLWRAVVDGVGVVAVLYRSDDSWRAGATAREIVVDPAALEDVIEIGV